MLYPKPLIVNIKLKGALDCELTRIGLQPGQVIENAAILSAKNRAVYFDRFHNHTRYQCVVYPNNYDIIKRLA